jgi:hypothetical protein
MAKIGLSYTVYEKGKKSPNWTVESDQDGEQTFEDLKKFTKGALINISGEALKEEQADGFDLDPTLIVDGKFNKKLQDVNPFGKIQYVARTSIKEIILYAYDAIAKRSPVDSGRYVGSNIVTFNESPIAGSRESLSEWLDNKADFKERDKIRFINTAPYARRLETLGISKGKRSAKTRFRKASRRKPAYTYKLPNGAYQLAFNAIKSNYRNNSFLAFEYVPGSKLGLVGPNRTFSRGKGKGSTYLYPTILIYAVAAGLVDAEGNK